MDKKRLLIVSLAAFCLSAPAAKADMLTFDVTNTTMDYHQSYNGVEISNTSNSTLQASLLNSGGTPIQSASIASGNNFAMSVNLSIGSSGGSYKATGAVALSDYGASENRIVGDFTSTRIDVYGGGNIYFLTITGTLDPLGTNGAVLNPWAASWTFDGDAPSAITIANPAGWDYGDMVTFNWGIGNISTPAAFFANDHTLFGGEAAFSAVPVPAAILLGMLGLSVAGVKLRKYV
jgi:hypothetical protein